MMNKDVKIQLFKDDGSGLDGYLTLTKESDLPFSLSIGDIKDISKRTSTVSKSIKLGGTKENNILLSHYYDVNTVDNSYDINRTQKCRVIIDGEVLYDNCIMQLIDIEKKQLTSYDEDELIYTVQIRSEQSNLFDKLKDKFLTDIELTIKDIPNNNSPTHFIYNPTFVKDSFNNNYTDGYKFINQILTNGAIGLNVFKPSTYLYTYWNRIISDAGFRYTFNEIGVVDSVLTTPTKDDLHFRKLLIPYTDASDDSKISDQIFYKMNVSSDDASAPYKIDMRGGTFSESIILNDVIKDESNSYLVGTYEYKSKYTGFIEYYTNNDYDIYFKNLNAFNLKASYYSPSRTYIKIKNSLYRNGVLMDEYTSGEFYLAQDQILTTGDNLLSSENNYTLLRCAVSPNDLITIKTNVVFESNYAQNLLIFLKPDSTGNTNYEVYLKVNKQTVDSNSKVMNGGLNFGSIIDMNNYIPKNVKQTDFFKSILNMFNLYVEVDKFDPNLLHFYTRDVYYETGAIKKWGSKLVKDNTQTLKLLSEISNKSKLFTYKQDSDKNNILYSNKYNGDTYGSARFTFDTQYATGEDKVEIIFAPSPILKDGDKFYTDLLENPLRILYDGGEKSCNSYTIKGWGGNSGDLSVSKYVVATHFDNPDNPTYDINFGTNVSYYYTPGNFTSNNLYNNYWRKTMYQLNTSRMLTASFVLNEQDIVNIKLNDLIYLHNEYWIINKIIDFNPIKTYITKVELISIDLDKTSRGKIISTTEGTTMGPVVNPVKPTDNGNINSGTISLGDPNSGSGTTGGVKGSVRGFGNIIGDDTTTVGDNNTNTGSGATVIGDDNINTGTNSNVTGDNNIVESTSTVSGTGNIIKPDATGSIISGTNNIIESSTTVVGDNNIIPGGIKGSVIFGSNITASEQGTVYMDNIRVFEVLTLDPGVIIDTPDGVIGGLDYLPLAGGTMSGPLIIDSGKILQTGFGNVSKMIGLDSSDNIVDAGPRVVKKGSGANSLISDNASTNIGSGIYSIALGKDNIASDYYAIGIGQGNSVNGENSVGIGGGNTIGSSAYYSATLGRDNTITSSKAYALGLSNTVSAVGAVALGRNLTANVADTTFVDGLNIKTLTGGGSSVNNLGIDASGRVVIGSSSGIISNTYSNVKILKNAFNLVVGSVYFLTDKNIFIETLSNNQFRIKGSKIQRIVKNTHYTPKVQVLITQTNEYLGIYGQTINQGSVPNSTGSYQYFAVWGGKVWRRDNSGADVPGPSDEVIGGGWTLQPLNDDVFYDSKIFDIVYDFENDYTHSQSDDRGNVITPVVFIKIIYIIKNDWGNINIKNNKCKLILNNFRDNLAAIIVNNVISGGIYNNRRGFISDNYNTGSIFNNLCGTGISLNSNVGDIKNNTIASSSISKNYNQGDIDNNIASNGINSNGNYGNIKDNSIGSGYIDNNLNGGNIIGNLRTSGSMYIRDNRNNGIISKNQGDVYIIENVNNGNIGNAVTITSRASTITDTRVNK